MYILYVDESGDPGMSEHSSLHYSLSSLIVEANNWKKYLVRLKAFRKHLKETYGLNQRTEIHASELVRVSKTKDLKKIRKSDRMRLMKECAVQIPNIFNDAKIINIYLKKEDFADTNIQEQAWKRLIQRFDNYMKKKGGGKGIIISDAGIGSKVTSVLRKMRIYNPISSLEGTTYNPVIENIVEDIFTHDSKDSYFIQCADLISYFLYRKEQPKGSLRKFGVEHYFNNLEPILLKVASRKDENGIVRK